MSAVSFKAMLTIMTRQVFLNIFYLDLRSLALFRIGLGIVSLYNLYTLYPDIDAFLGAHGIAPLSHFRVGMPMSFYAFSDNNFYIRGIFYLHVVFAFMLTFGFKTRLATAACFLLTLSLFNRLLPIEYGADKVLRIFLLWGIFLPLGARYSFDRYFSKEKEILSHAYVSFATGAFIFQMIMIYLFTALARTHACWLKDNTALNYGFQYFPYLIKPFATWLLNFPDLLKYLTFITHRLELFGGILLLIPVCSWLWRSIAIFAFIALHVGVYLTFKLDPFPALMIIGWAALVPSRWWGQKSHADNIRYNYYHNKYFNYLIILLLGITLWLNCRFVKTLHQQQLWQPTRVESFLENVGLKQRWMMFHMNKPNTNSRWEFVPIYKRDFKRNVKNRTVHLKSINSTHWINLSESINGEGYRKYIPFITAYLKRQWAQEDSGIDFVHAQQKVYNIELLE